jgi:fido (protein-threonine AMPylation protein)
MAKYEGQDHYLDPETGVLKNKLGIRDEERLKRAEASLVAWRSFELSQKPVQGSFDLDHLKAIHKHSRQQHQLKRNPA